MTTRLCSRRIAYATAPSTAVVGDELSLGMYSLSLRHQAVSETQRTSDCRIIDGSLKMKRMFAEGGDARGRRPEPASTVNSSMSDGPPLADGVG